MKTVLIAFCLTTLFVSEGVLSLSLGDLIPLCSRKDPQLSECVRDSARKLIPFIAKGIEEWKLAPIDPIVTPKVELSENTDDIKMQITYTNVVQTGLSQVSIDNAIIDLDGGIMIFNVTYPVFIFVGDYDAKGRILHFDVTGSGKANITVLNSKSDLIFKFHVEEDHIRQDSLQVAYIFDQIFLNYTHFLFNGDEELGKSASAFINENAVDIMNGFKPSLEKFYGGLLTEHVKGLFDNVPYSVLFRDG